MKKFILTSLSIAAISFVALAQNVNIPDVNFKAKLLANGSINTDTDKLNISVAEALAYKGSINVYNSNIASLTGIEAFVNITTLACDNNKLTSIDVSKNTALTGLRIMANKISELDISKNIGLTNLECSNNLLTQLDLSNNAATLSDLRCNSNLLTSLDISKLKLLWLLRCADNKLTKLDVSENTALGSIVCGSNQISSLDVSRNTKLYELNFSGNQISSINLNNIPQLIYLYCDGNLLTSLDMTANTEITQISCFSNPLVSLNLSKNTVLNQLHCANTSLNSLDLSHTFELASMICTNCPNLMCIRALNSQDKSQWYKDDNTYYSETPCITTDLSDDSLKTPKIISSIYNIQGQQVSKHYSGLVIYKYTDGTTEKVVQE